MTLTRADWVGHELEEETGQRVETACADNACENSGNKAKWRKRAGGSRLRVSRAGLGRHLPGNKSQVCIFFKSRQLDH